MKWKAKEDFEQSDVTYFCFTRGKLMRTMRGKDKSRNTYSEALSVIQTQDGRVLDQVNSSGSMRSERSLYLFLNQS